jgi:CubicO group peptidase (beta-lactamase class C family)
MTPPIHGTVASGFEEVKREFERNFTHRKELGAACAIYYRGQKVVDLWGGYRDAEGTKPWEEDTLMLVFSTTKGISSLALALAHSRGLFDYDEKVATYWKAFAQNGKENVTVRQLLSHQAGLAVIDEPLTMDILGDVERLSAILAKQKPSWTVGERHGYHGITLGWYESELLRHVDPQGRTLGQYFRDEVAKPLDLEFYIGLPDDIPDERLAKLKVPPTWQVFFNLHKLPFALLRKIFDRQSLTVKAFRNPEILGDANNYNRRDVMRLEIPAANGIGQVRSIAKVYSEFATGGKTLGIKPETLNAITEAAQPPSGGIFDLILQHDTVFSLGYLKPTPTFPFGSPQAFGHSGNGGSFAYADPQTQIGFAYAMNRTDYWLVDDPRQRALRQAMMRCIGNR